MRHPTIKPVTDMTKIDVELKPMSLVVRPTRTAERAIGNDRNRSMIPLVMSSASPTPVKVEPKMTVWTNTPAMRYSRYETTGIFIELSNKYANRTSNLHGEYNVYK